MTDEASSTSRFARETEMHAVTVVPDTSRHSPAEVGRFAPMTAERFNFDAFCSIQVFLFLKPTASGAAMWDLSPKVFCEYSHFIKLNSLETEELTPSASGALLLDASSIFRSAVNSGWNTPQRLFHFAASKDMEFSGFHETWKTIVGPFVLPTTPALTSIAIDAAESDSIDLATPYAGLLNELRATSPWKSWKKLAPLLGTSHTQLRRIVDGTVGVPSITEREERHRDPAAYNVGFSGVHLREVGKHDPSFHKIDCNSRKAIGC